jgi:uncharacterized membrane protein YccF (DUF307 family)
MKTILNVLWLVLSGFWLALGYVLAGVLCCILVVTIPFGIASFRIAGYALWPFGRTIVDKPGAGAGSVIGNVIWIIFAGLWLAIGHIVSGIALCITIIGIPFGIAAFRIANYALWPFGRSIIRTEGAGAGSAIGNVIWIVFAGLWLAIGHIVSGIALCITIIGIPFGIANFKMVPISLVPLGKDIVSTDALRQTYPAGYPQR